MILRLSDSSRDSLAETLAAALKTGGSIRFYATKKGDALATLPLISVAAKGPNVEFSAEEVKASATGRAIWARVQDASGNTVFECDVATSGALITIDDADLKLGGTVTLKSLTITVPTG